MNDFFTYIDYGAKANKFLKDCDVRDQPTSIEIAELLVKSSLEIWNSIVNDGNNEKHIEYLIILDRIATNYHVIVIKSGLVESMKEAPILAAIIMIDDKVAKYHLASAKEIFINNDAEYQKIFNP